MPKTIPLERFALVALVEVDQALADPGVGHLDAADHFAQERVFRRGHPTRRRDVAGGQTKAVRSACSM